MTMKGLKEKQVGKWTIQIKENTKNGSFDVIAHVKKTVIGRFRRLEDAELFYNEKGQIGELKGASSAKEGKG